MTNHLLPKITLKYRLTKVIIGINAKHIDNAITMPTKVEIPISGKREFQIFLAIVIANKL